MTPMSSTFHSPFSLGQKVNIDGDTSIAATVIGFAFYVEKADVLVSWWHNGELRQAWVTETRLRAK